MSTTGGEPRLLLNTLKPMLGMNGDIKTPQEVVRIVGMMKDAEKLVSRCVYLSILRATCDAAENSIEKRDALLRFLAGGGWGILNKWMTDFSKTENHTMLSELLEVLKLLPVSVELLKQGNTGKIVKQLTKASNEVLKKSASVLIRKWKDMIRGDPSSERAAPNGVKRADEAESVMPSTVKRHGSIDAREPPDKRPRLGSNGKPLPKVKLIDPLPKSAMESGGFMDALNAAATTAAKKKRKLIPTKGAVTNAGGAAGPRTHLPLDEILSGGQDGNPSATPPHDGSDIGVSPAGSPRVKEEAVPSPLGQSDGLLTGDGAKAGYAKKLSPDVAGSPGRLGKKTKKRKSLRWAPDEALVEISYFEIDEEERAKMHHGSFDTAKHNELLLERRALASAKKYHEDTMTEKMPWRRPVSVDAPPLTFELGSKSKEKVVQMEREKKVLADIFLTKASLPDSPAEADVEADSGMRADPVLIPHDEDGTVYPIVSSTAPTVKPPPPAARVTEPAPKIALAKTVAADSDAKVTSSTVQTILDQLMVKKKDNVAPLHERRRDYPALDESQAPPTQLRNPKQQQPPPMGPRHDMTSGEGGHPDGPQMEGPRHDGPFDDSRHPPNGGGYNGHPQMHPGHLHGPPMHMMRPRGPPPAGQPVPLLSMKLPPRPNRGNFRGGPRGMGPRGGPHPDHMGPRFHGRNFDDGGNMDGDYDMGDDDGMGGPPPGMGGPPGPWMRPPFRGRGRGMMRGRGRGGRDVCRHFLSNHGCRMGLNCHFLHPGVNGPPIM